MSFFFFSIPTASLLVRAVIYSLITSRPLQTISLLAVLPDSDPTLHRCHSEDSKADSEPINPWIEPFRGC